MTYISLAQITHNKKSALRIYTTCNLNKIRRFYDNVYSYILKKYSNNGNVTNQIKPFNKFV